nr:TatD family hydrolase [bacterium]
MIIDAHVHPFYIPRENFGPGRYGGPETPQAFQAGLARAGIDRFAGSVITSVDGKDFEPIRQLNRHALALKQTFGAAYIPGIHIHPAFVDESMAEIDWARENGIRLIGELVCYMMGYDHYATPACLEILRYARDKGMVLSIHPSEDEDDMEALFAALPGLPIIAAHPGEKREYMHHLDRMARYENTYLDISGTGLFRNLMLRYGIDRLGAGRFLLGTDYPICNPAMQVAGARYEGLTPEEEQAVFSGNFLSLFPEAGL